MTVTPVEQFCKEEDLRLITVHVGGEYEFPPPTVFQLPAQLLCKSSDFFRNALCENFEEAETGTIRLSDVDASTFGHFIQWLFAGKVLLDKDFWRLESQAKQGLKLFKFGDKILNKDLQNEAIKIMFDVGQPMLLSWLEPCIPDAYACTLPGHPVRKLLAMIAAYQIAWDPDKLDCIMDMIAECPEFLKDMWAELPSIGMPPTYPKAVDRYLVK